MRRRLLSLLLCLGIAATLLPATVWAASPSWDYGASDMDNSVQVTVDIASGTMTVSGNGAMYDQPDSYTPPWWGSATDWEPSQKSLIKNVVVESGITHIGAKAFKDLSNLESVTIGGDVTSIGSQAFCECPKLTEITIPSSVTEIGDSAFAGCNALELVKGGEGVTDIGTDVFTHFSSDGRPEAGDAKWLLVEPQFFETLCATTSAPGLVFAYTSDTNGVTITKVHVSGSGMAVEVPGTINGESVTAIGAGVFADAEISQWAIESVTLPNTITSIGDNAFKGCDSMESIKLPSRLETIGDSAFEGCSQLTGVTLPSGLTEIGAKAFAGCCSIDGLEIPSSVQTIGENAFERHGNGMFIVPDAIKNQMAITMGDDSEYYPNMIAYEVDGNNVTLTKLIATINNVDMSDSITLPGTVDGKTVTAIGDKFAVTEKADGNNTYLQPDISSDVKTIELPAGVTSIGANAFAQCYDLERITGLDHVTTIGANAFTNTGLKSVKLSDSLTAIPDGAFDNCWSLADVTIPESVTSIGAKAFYFTALTSVTIPKNVTSIGAEAFVGCQSLTTFVNLGTYKGSINSAVVNGSENLTVVWPPLDSDLKLFLGKVTFYYTRNAANSNDVTITDVAVGNGATSAAFPANTGLNVTMVLMQQNGLNGITITGVDGPQLTWRNAYGDDGEVAGVEITKIVPVNGQKVTLPETVKATVHNGETSTVENLPVVSVDEDYRQYADHGSRPHVYVEHGQGICQLCGEKGECEHQYVWVQEVQRHYQVCKLCKEENHESYGEHTYDTENVCTVCKLKKPSLSSIALPEHSSVRTEYLVGQKFDPTNLYLECTYAVGGSDSITESVGYRSGTASRFSFTPDLNTALTAENKKVTVSYTEGDVTLTVEIPITVQEGTPVTGVTLDKTTAEMKVGETLTLTATVAPENATITDVEWNTPDWGEVVTVMNDGRVTARKAGTATITVTTVDGRKTATCTITVKAEGTGGNTGDTGNTGNTGGSTSRPSTGGSSSGGSGSTSTSTTKNPDGSTTTKTENKTTGTVTETTKNPDGSQTKVETKKDGTVTTTETDKAGNKSETVEKPDGSTVTKVAQKDGTTATVSTDASGRTEAEVKLPKAAVSQAQQGGEAVTLPIPEVQATKNADTAPAVTVKTGSAGAVKVEIPMTNPAPGAVAVLVKADGSEEIIKTSVPTADGVAVELPDGATVKIVDNSKSFADVSSSSWASDAVDFVSARELFGGTSPSTFTPEAPMTRAMLVTVLARFDGADTSGGSTWYQKGVDWAAAKGVSDGSNPNGSVTREQLATMLWRYAGSPSASGSLDGYTDAGQVSGYAQEAMRWAVANGVINGYGNGQLGPQGQATRAQVAQMLKNYIEKN